MIAVHGVVALMGLDSPSGTWKQASKRHHPAVKCVKASTTYHRRYWFFRDYMLRPVKVLASKP